MYYAAYGSNINLEQMAYRCPYSHVIGKGKVLNYRLVFNFHADIIPANGVDTPVLIWEIDDSDWRNSGAGWSATPEGAWKDAYSYYERHYKNE